MPITTWHKYKIKHDSNLNNHINKTMTDYNDWKVITLFYSLLHSVDEYLCEAPRNIHPNDHGERDREVSIHLRNIKSEYRKAREFSEYARYEKDISYSDLLFFIKKYTKVKKFLTPTVCPKCGIQFRLNTGKCIRCGSTF